VLPSIGASLDVKCLFRTIVEVFSVQKAVFS